VGQGSLVELTKEIWGRRAARVKREKIKMGEVGSEYQLQTDTIKQR
jgi:hypothetical protein